MGVAYKVLNSHKSTIINQENKLIYSI